MKKGISFLCALTMLFALTACGGQGSDTDTPSAGNSSSRPVDESQSSPGESQDTESPAEGGKALVAYFSATGNTKGIAEQIAGLTGGDLYEIIPAEPYTDEDLDYSDSQSRTSLEMDDPDARPEISSEAISISEYAVLYLGYPIWHGQAPRILSTFAESYDFDGLTIIPFCTSGGSGIGSSAEVLAEQAGSGSWLDGERFSAGAARETLADWIDGLALEAAGQ